MARTGGRSAVFAWIVGSLCAAVVITLAVLTLPLLPIGATWFGGEATPEASDAPAREAVPGEPRECQDLYGDALWAALRWTPSAELEVSRDAPATAATGVVDTLTPDVRFTCAWTSERGEISTTYADVPADAPSVIRAVLPEEGFTCDKVADRIRCTRTTTEGEGDEAIQAVETIEAGDGRWLSSVQHGWHPQAYAGRTADRVWAVSLAAD